MKKLFYLTQAGIEELKEELKALLGQRTTVADRIRQARELGDLSENAEYQTAREDQDRLETRIGELDHILKNSQMIKKPKTSGEVKLGSVVELKAGSKTQKFQIVGTMEADPLNGKVSDESPIGKLLIGKKTGEKVNLNHSASTSYKISKIS